MKKRYLAGLFAIALSTSLVVPCHASDSNRTEIWKIAAMGSETNPTTQGWYAFEKLIEEKLDTVDVQVFINGQLGTSTDACVGGMQTNIIQFSDISIGNVVEYSNAFLPMDTPFLFADRDTALSVVDGDIGKMMADQFESDADVVTLGYWDYGFRELTNSKKAVASLDDMNGLKIRTLSSNTYIDMLNALGANATTMAYAEVFTGLQQGTIDGQENPLSTIVDAGFYEVNPYLTMTDHVYGFLGFFCGADWFYGLDEEVQEIVRSCAAEAIAQQREINAASEEAAIKTLEEAGVEITYLDDETKASFREATSSIWEDIRSKTDKSFGEEYYQSIVDAAGIQS